MKCPKCQYISFGNGSRCRNCGYEFSLTGDAPPADLPITAHDAPVGPFTDLPLSAPPPANRSELPLFPVGAAHDDVPLVTVPAVPRAPIAVRRPAPVPPKAAHPRLQVDREPELELEPEPEPQPAAERPRPRQRSEAQPIPDTAAGEHGQAAPVAARMIAAAIDLAIAGGIDATVLYLTLRLAGLTFAELSVLPEVPLITFLLLLNGGYFVLFTAAGGQTIGKMAAGIRVVPQQPDVGLRVPFSTAVVRAVAYGISLLPAGLGFVPILFSPDGRALHDRLSDTRVVKA
jgi:uncharacterized RDD family membrane protein YckC